ncbi:hypothetical protein DRN73_03135 [Candidatus Pacearchaeota archaeon]|nr:MAG: hypothetical protein DRN73_03135 [Candidatus Pacearchaeota archaeon]
MDKIDLSIFDKKRKLKIPKKINEDLAEEVGIHVGDGSMNIYNKSYVYSLEGHIIDDRKYFLNHISPLFKRLYNLNIRLRERKSAGVFGFQVGSKGLINFKSNLGLPLGSKEGIEIPRVILNSNKKILAGFIRGLFDTDGGIYLEKKYKKFYPRIQLVNKSLNLMKQVKKILTEVFEFNLSSRIEDKYCRLIIRGDKNFKKWMKIIGTNNPKNVKKYKLYTQ